jgi:hypothetical protein
VLDYEVDAVNRQPQKIIAKLVNGVRIGMGFKFERACRSECSTCPADADAFHRSCRLFTFKPHYQVALRVGPSDGKVSYTALQQPLSYEVNTGFVRRIPVRLHPSCHIYAFPYPFKRHGLRFYE